MSKHLIAAIIGFAVFVFGEIMLVRSLPQISELPYCLWFMIFATGISIFFVFATLFIERKPRKASTKAETGSSGTREFKRS